MSDAQPSAGLEATVTHKLGPLPVWGWAAMIAGGAWAYYLYKGRVSTGAVPQATDTTGSTSSGTGTDAPGVNLGLGTNPPTGAAGSPSVTTNAQWARQTLDSLIAGGADPTLASDAISTYMNGGTLTSAQQSIIDKALQSFGSPPEGAIPVQASPLASLPFSNFVKYVRDASNGAIYGVDPNGTMAWLNPAQYKALGDPAYQSLAGNAAPPAPPVHAAPSPAPAAPAAPAPAAPHTYVVQAGDSLSLIAQRTYGNAMMWPTIYNANKGVVGSNPNLIYPGQKLVLP